MQLCNYVLVYVIIPVKFFSQCNSYSISTLSRLPYIVTTPYLFNFYTFSVFLICLQN